jgi:hypothetical protein
VGARSLGSDDPGVPRNVARAVNARSLLLVAGAVAVAAFAVPWAVISAIQKTVPAQAQTVVVPPGSKVTVLKSSAGAKAGVVVVTGTSGGTTTGPATTTTASKPPPPGA